MFLLWSLANILNFSTSYPSAVVYFSIQSGRLAQKRNKLDNSCPSSARLSEEVMADDRDGYEFLMQASTVRKLLLLVA